MMMRSLLSRITPAAIVGLLIVACAADAPTPRTPNRSTGPSGPPGTPTPAAASPSAAPSAPPDDGSAWLDAGELIEPRNATNVVVLGTGEVLVVGSDYETSWLSACGASTNGSDSVEIGDPMTGVWEKTTSLTSLRDDPVVVALTDGRALLIGGAAGEEIGWSAFSSTYIFSGATRSWSRSGLLNTARTGAAGAALLIDGRVLVAGGMFLDRASSEPGRVLDTAEIWDPASGAWSHTGRLWAPRVGASAVALADGRVLVVGGSASLESRPIQQGTAETWDPYLGEWSSAGTLAVARSGFALVALRDGGAIVVGGYDDEATTRVERLSSVERFDPVSSTWSPAESLPGPVVGPSAISLADGRILVAGGSVREPVLNADGTEISGFTADAFLFDPNTGTWTQTISMPKARAGASAVLLADGSVVVVGGSASEGELDATPGCPIAEPQVLRYVPGS